MSKSNDSSSAPASPSSLPLNTTINPSPVTTKTSGRAQKGIRLVTIDPRTGGDIYLFYQWNNNGLRYISQSPKGVWQGSTDLHVTDAKPGTPLESVSTISNGSTLVSYLPCRRYLFKSEQW